MNENKLVEVWYQDDENQFRYAAKHQLCDAIGYGETPELALADMRRHLPEFTKSSRIVSALAVNKPAPIPMLLWCPSCGSRHIDDGEFSTKPHHTHACQSCGMAWRPAVVDTVGVEFLPGFKNGERRVVRTPCDKPACGTCSNA